MNLKVMRQKISNYLASDEIKSPAKLREILGMTRNDFSGLLHIEGKKADLLRETMRTIESDMIEKSLIGKYSASIATFLLRAEFEYNDKAEQFYIPETVVKLDDSANEYAK